MSTNPFGLLDDPILAEPADTPAIPVTTAPVVAAPTKTYPELAPQRGKRHNNPDAQKTTSNKPASTSEHAPNRLVYSREWLLTCCKNYAAPGGFTSSSSAFHEISQLPVALLPHTHEVRRSRTLQMLARASSSISCTHTQPVMSRWWPKRASEIPFCVFSLIPLCFTQVLPLI